VKYSAIFLTFRENTVNKNFFWPDFCLKSISADFKQKILFPKIFQDSAKIHGKKLFGLKSPETNF